MHGVPGARILRPGDLVSLDVTAELDGYIADAATTIPLAPYSATAERLCRSARTAFKEAAAVARAGRPINCIGRAVEREVSQSGFTVLKELAGHGTGRRIHEDPIVSNFYDPANTQLLTDGLVLTIEPLIAERSQGVFTDSDGWTLRTDDADLSAHYEHTLVITKDRPILITAA